MAAVHYDSGGLRLLWATAAVGYGAVDYCSSGAAVDYGYSGIRQRWSCSGLRLQWTTAAVDYGTVGCGGCGLLRRMVGLSMVMTTPGVLGSRS